MAVLPRFLATTPPPRESGLARAQDIGALTRTGDIEVWRGVSRIGGAMQYGVGLAFDAYQKRKQLDDIIESGIATQRAQESFIQGENVAEAYKPAQDMPEPDDPDYMSVLTPFSTTKRGELLADNLKDREKDASKLSQGIRDPKTRARWENWYNENYAKFADRIRHIYDEKLNLYQTDAIDQLWQAAAQNGNTKIANFYIDVMQDYGLITIKQARTRKGQVDTIATESLTLAYQNAIWDLITEKPYEEAIDIVNNLPLSDIFDEPARKALIARRNRQNEIETVETDPIAKGQLEDKAYDVWSGAQSLEQYKTELDTALGKTIDASAYDELFSLAQREYKAHQGRAMKTAVDDAARQLIELRTEPELLAFLPGKTKAEQEQVLSDRQLQMWNHTQYRKALSDWFRANPDANADEIYIQGQKLLVLYRGRRPDELKQRLGEQEKKLLTVSPKVSAKMLEAARKVTSQLKGNYDYEGAIAAGLGPDKKGHWPSQFKSDDSPERYIRGLDTKSADVSDVIRVYTAAARVTLPAEATPKEIAAKAKQMAKDEGWKVE